jgi:hypothetical protein
MDEMCVLWPGALRQSYTRMFQTSAHSFSALVEHTTLKATQGSVYTAMVNLSLFDPCTLNELLLFIMKC